MKINREKLLVCLESVYPGVARKPLYEQSTSFCFHEGLIWTFNGEVACRYPSPFGKEFTGAIPADKFLEAIRKLPDDEFQVEPDQDKVTFRSRAGRRIRLLRETEITLPLNVFDEPKEWHKLPEDFPEAIQIVGNCAGTNETKFWTTCIHIHPKWIEASDDTQICRYKLILQVNQSILVRQSSIKHAATMALNEYGETDTWLHFRNDGGLILSCRRYLEECPDMTPYLKVQGIASNLPKSLSEAASYAKIFSDENPTGLQQIKVNLKPGIMWVIGQGVSGDYGEPKKVTYDGPPLSFFIKPELLMKLVEKHTECQITDGKLRVDGNKFRYIVCLVKDQSNNGKE